MRDFLIVFKVLFKNQYSRRIGSGGKPKLPAAVTSVLGMIPLAVLACIIGGMFAAIIPDVGTLSAVSNLIVSAVQLFVLFLSLFNVMNILYNSPDTPFLNTLPVRPTAVFFAKFALVYLSALSMMASVLIPSLLTVSIVYAAYGRAMFYGYFVLILLITAVAPILPLFIVTLFSMPLSYLGTFFKGKSVLKTILSLLFYMLIMVGYLLLVYFASKNEGDFDPSMPQNALNGLSVFAKVMYPNKVLIDFCLGISAGKNFGISFAITVGMLAVMLIAAKFFYRRINEKRLETHAESSHKSASFKQSNIIVSLMKKDFMSIIRNSNMAMSCVANIIICPVITAIMYFAGNMQTADENTPMYVNSMLKLSYIVLYSLIFLGGTNTMAMLAYTREGKSFYLSKSLPIRAKDSITAKFLLSIIPSGIVMVIQTVLAFALYKLDLLSVFLFVICTLMTIVGASALHIYCDMRFGNVNWNTRQDMRQVTNGNKGSLIVAFWVVFIGISAMIFGMVLSAFADSLGGMIVTVAVFWTILFILSAATFIAGILVLIFKAEPLYNKIGEREFKPRSYVRNQRSGFGGNKGLLK